MTQDTHELLLLINENDIYRLSSELKLNRKQQGELEKAYIDLIKKHKKQLDEIDEFNLFLKDEINKMKGYFIELIENSKSSNNEELNRLLTCLNISINEIDNKLCKPSSNKNTSSKHSSHNETLFENNNYSLKINQIDSSSNGIFNKLETHHDNERVIFIYYIQPEVRKILKEFDNKLQSEFKRIENYFDRDLYLIKKKQASILNKRITSDKLMNNKVEWMPKRSETSTISYESGFKHHRQTNENESPKDRIKKSIINLNKHQKNQ